MMQYSLHRGEDLRLDTQHRVKSWIPWPGPVLLAQGGWKKCMDPWLSPALAEWVSSLGSVRNPVSKNGVEGDRRGCLMPTSVVIYTSMIIYMRVQHTHAHTHASFVKNENN